MLLRSSGIAVIAGFVLFLAVAFGLAAVALGVFFFHITQDPQSCYLNAASEAA